MRRPQIKIKSLKGYPRNQCQSLGGTSSGTCASGFGVCCTCAYK